MSETLNQTHGTSKAHTSTANRTNPLAVDVREMVILVITLAAMFAAVLIAPFLYRGGPLEMDIVVLAIMLPVISAFGAFAFGISIGTRLGAAIGRASTLNRED